MEEDNSILVEKYLANELEGDELIRFEEKLKTDSSFAEEVALYKELSARLSTNFIHEEEEIKLKKTLSTLGDQHIDQQNQKEPKVISMKRYYWLAASVVIFFGIFIFTKQSSKPGYSDFSDHQTLVLTERGSSDTLKIKAEQAFNESNYKEALGYLDQLLQFDQENTQFRLYKGISLLEINEFEKAEQIFNEIRNSNRIYRDKALWYLALSALKQKKYSQCESLLKEITENSDDSGKVKELLNDL